MTGGSSRDKNDRPERPIVFRRAYLATVQDLWSLWTTKEGFESWWGPTGFRVQVHALDARLGGELHYDMFTESPDHAAEMARLGREASTETRGKFVEFQPFNRLAIEHAIDFIPGVEPYEHRIEVEFSNNGDKAEMLIRIDPAHDRATTKLSKIGFAGQLKKLKKAFSGDI